MFSKWSVRLSLLLAMILLFVTACGEKEEKEELTITPKNVAIIDGETIKVVSDKGKEETVKLILIEAPNLSKKDPFSQEAKTMLETTLKNAKKITLKKDTNPRDKDKNFLAYVIADGKDVQETLIMNGLARVKAVPPNVKKEKDYKALQSEAQTKKVGIWSIPDYVQDDGFHPEVTTKTGPFVASKNSDVYHKVSCSDVSKILEENRIYFQTEDEAKASGRKRSETPGCWN